MNKTDLIRHIAEHTDMKLTEATRALEVTLSGITQNLRNGDKVTLVGFGSFSVSHRAERQGRNPRTGEPMTISAANVVRFKAGKELQDEVNTAPL